MTKQPALIALAALLPLAACNQSPTVSATNATQGEVQEKVAAAIGKEAAMVQPGRWEGSMTMHELDLPSMPASVKAQMKARMSAARPFVSCLTEEDVKQQKAFFTGDANDKSCKYDHFSLAGGKIDAAMNCDHGDSGKMVMTMTGQYAPDSYQMDMSTKAEGSGPMAGMTMKMTVTAKRVGACTGAKDEL